MAKALNKLFSKLDIHEINQMGWMNVCVFAIGIILLAIGGICFLYPIIAYLASSLKTLFLWWFVEIHKTYWWWGLNMAVTGGGIMGVATYLDNQLNKVYNEKLKRYWDIKRTWTHRLLKRGRR